MGQWDLNVKYHAKIQDVGLFHCGRGSGKRYRGHVAITRILSTETMTIIKEEEPTISS